MQSHQSLQERQREEALQDLDLDLDLDLARLPARPLPGRCAVCGCDDVHTDEVFDGGGWLLAECPRCDHRSMQPLAGRARRVRGRRPQPARVPADAA